MQSVNYPKKKHKNTMARQENGVKPTRIGNVGMREWGPGEAEPSQTLPLATEVRPIFSATSGLFVDFPSLDQCCESCTKTPKNAQIGRHERSEAKQTRCQPSQPRRTSHASGAETRPPALGPANAETLSGGFSPPKRGGKTPAARGATPPQ